MHRHVFAIDIFGERYLTAPGIHCMNFKMLDLIDTLTHTSRALDTQVRNIGSLQLTTIDRDDQ